MHAYLAAVCMEGWANALVLVGASMSGGAGARTFLPASSLVLIVLPAQIADQGCQPWLSWQQMQGWALLMLQGVSVLMAKPSSNCSRLKETVI
jgi:hypothetical protein